MNKFLHLIGRQGSGKTLLANMIAAGFKAHTGKNAATLDCESVVYDNHTPQSLLKLFPAAQLIITEGIDSGNQLLQQLPAEALVLVCTTAGELRRQEAAQR